MDLIRLDSNPSPSPDRERDEYRQSEFEIYNVADDFLPEDSKLRVNFSRFGLGPKRRPNFAVEVNWIDVRGFVREFIEMGHPEALQLQRMLKLAEAIENAGWRPDDPATEDFWDILPPQSN
jgi:hypothetical protein